MAQDGRYRAQHCLAARKLFAQTRFNRIRPRRLVAASFIPSL
jgi:hypothetical protein